MQSLKKSVDVACAAQALEADERVKAALAASKLEELRYAQTAFLIAANQPDDLPALSGEATALHDDLYADALVLTQHGFGDQNQLAQLLGGDGYENPARDPFVS
jgi:hypothetical protein